jgi:hypothetical protein
MRSVRLHVVFVLVLLAMVSVAVPAFGGPPSKPFAATVGPDALSAGATVPSTLTIQNDSKSQSLGSANLTRPSGFAFESTDAHALLGGDPGSPIGDAAIVGDRIQLRNLSLPTGSFLTLSFVVQAPCTAGASAWSITAKQSNDFNGAGNDFTLEPPPATHLTTTVSGTCKLVFLDQPAETQIGTGVTDGPFQSGAPIQVAIETQAGAVVTASSAPVTLGIGTVPPGGTSSLDGTTLVTPLDGVATFCDPDHDPGCTLPSIAVHGLGYTLSASSNGADTAASDAFDVVDAGAVCDHPGPCHAQATLADTSAVDTVTAVPDDVVAVSIGVEALTCAGYTNTSQVVTFSSTANSEQVVTITIAAASVHKPAAQFQVCFSSSVPFTDRSGNVVPPGGTGLLRDCSNKVGPPCTVSRVKDKITGDVTLTFRAPAGDPKGVG